MVDHTHATEIQMSMSLNAVAVLSHLFASCTLIRSTRRGCAAVDRLTVNPTHATYKRALRPLCSHVTGVRWRIYKPQNPTLHTRR